MPIIKPHGVGDLQFGFYNSEAFAWYDPLKPYTLLEYEWVRKMRDLEGITVIDAGCHHGNYSVIFKPAHVIAVDSSSECLDFAAENMRLNGLSFETRLQTLGTEGVQTDREVSIYKCDIEGAEFELFPNEIDRFPLVKTWIVEIHPKRGNPDTIAREFAERGFELLKVCRETLSVKPYQIGDAWKSHATLIAC